MQIIIAVIICLFTSISAFAESSNVSQINHLNRASGRKWIAADNNQMTFEEFKARLLPIEQTEKEKAFLNSIERNQESMSSVVLPAKYDLRNVDGKNYMTPVKNQGGCGSCWAFATVASYESKYLMDHNIPGYNLDLSEQEMLSCGKAGSCSGGYIDAALYHFQKDQGGITFDKYVPYQGVKALCSTLDIEHNKFTMDKYLSSQRDYEEDGTFIGPTINSIKRTIYQGGAIVTIFNVPTSFYNYSSGIYSPVEDDTIVGRHAVVLVGWNDDEEYFIIKNSWGESWGESGYFRVPYSQTRTVEHLTTTMDVMGWYTVGNTSGVLENTSKPMIPYALLLGN